MPQRINGIGTTYLGKSNVLTRRGECEACRAAAILLSYDTRLWFTFFFIPLIPLGKKRVLDYCSSCTTHRAVALTEWEGIRKKSMEEAARKALAEPANAEAQIELHRTCLVMGEWGKADAFQKKLEDEFAKDAKVQLYLAGAHAYRGRAAEAEAALARARAIDPAVAPEAPPEGPRKTVKSGGAGRQAVLLGVLVGLILIGASIASVVMAGSRTLYIVSGYDEALTVEVAGQPAVSVRGGGKLPFPIPEGRHRARVTGAVKEEIDFVLESSFFTRLFDDRVFILNPGGAALLVQEEAFYGTNAPAGTFRLLYGKTFLALDDIDYEFAPFPSQIRTKEKGLIKKKRVDLAEMPVRNAMFGLDDLGRHEEALSLGEWAIRSRPAERDGILPYYASLARRLKKDDRALALLRERVAARPVEIDAHRQYQQMRGTAKDLPLLRAEYDAALAKTPGDADLLYLRGRLEGRIRDARSWYEKALRADPKQSYAHYALGYGYAASGDWENAKASLTKAVEGRPESAEFKLALRHARVGAGDLEAAEKEIREAVKKAPVLLRLSQELARVLVARGKIAEAKALVEPYRDVLRRAKEPEWAELVRGLEAEVLYAAGEFEALLNLKGKNPKEPPYDRAVALMELGKVEEALKQADPPDVQMLLAATLARPEDAGLRERAAAALEEEDVDAAPLAKALRSGDAADVAEALEVSVEASLKGAALAVLAARIPARATELRRQAASLNKQLVFPYHAVKRSLAGR